jgi:hypothetical protein
MNPAADDIDQILRIPEVMLTLKPFRGAPVEFMTHCSRSLFWRLFAAARRAERIISLSVDGLALDDESRAALNSYLRTYRNRRGGQFPFQRQDYSGVHTRYQWEVFCRYLNLTFIP